MCIFQPFFSKELVIHIHHQLHMILRRFLKLNWILNCMIKAIFTNLNDPKSHRIRCIFSPFKQIIWKPISSLISFEFFKFFEALLNIKQFDLGQFQQLFWIKICLKSNCFLHFSASFKQKTWNSISFSISYDFTKVFQLNWVQMC